MHDLIDGGEVDHLRVCLEDFDSRLLIVPISNQHLLVIMSDLVYFHLLEYFLPAALPSRNAENSQLNFRLLSRTIAVNTRSGEGAMCAGRHPAHQIPYLLFLSNASERFRNINITASILRRNVRAQTPIRAAIIRA